MSIKNTIHKNWLKNKHKSKTKTTKAKKCKTCNMQKKNNQKPNPLISGGNPGNQSKHLLCAKDHCVKIF